MSDEVIVEDPTTGGRKARKLARFDLIPPEVEWELAEHYGKGCQKYADRNWERGYAWSLSYGALRRHLNQWMNGEDVDLGTDSHHLIAVIWHAIALYTFQVRGLGTDDLRTVRTVHTDGVNFSFSPIAKSHPGFEQSAVEWLKEQHQLDESFRILMTFEPEQEEPSFPDAHSPSGS